MNKILIPVLGVLFVACTGGEVRVVRDVGPCDGDSVCNDFNDESVDYCDTSGHCAHDFFVETPVGCESDSDCDDGDPASVDTCVALECQHDRNTVTEVPVGCSADADCEDGDLSTADACIDLVCHRTATIVVELPPDFDPSAASRQDARVLCEMPVSCPAGNAVELSSCFSQTGANPWDDRGYTLYVNMSRSTDTVIHVAPRLWVGDPADRFHVTVSIDYPARTILETDLSVDEIQTGFDIDRTIPGMAFLSSYVTITLLPIGDVHSRSLQWAVLPGDITSASGTALTGCLQTGPFVAIPTHGFLFFQEGPTGEPQCAGTVLRTDPWPGGGGVTEGWVREESDPTLHYFYRPPAPGATIFDFATSREMVDWMQYRYSTYSTSNAHLFCNLQVSVVPDGSLATSGLPHRMVGYRPGILVIWTDPAGYLRHGVADGNFTILDTGTATATNFDGYGLQCSRYGAWAGYSSLYHSCDMELTASDMTRYTFVPASADALDPDVLFNGVDVPGYTRYTHH